MEINEKVAAACLQRDAYLDWVFSHEAKMLDKELDTPNSEAARTHLAKHLNLLDRKQVTFALSRGTVDDINKVCEQKNVPRDSFINRVLFFLSIGSLTMLEGIWHLDRDECWDRMTSSWDFTSMPFMPDHLNGSLSAIRDVVFEDPFWILRLYIEQANKEGHECPSFYKALIPRDYFSNIPSSLGFNCYYPDDLIEGHPAQIAAKAAKEEMRKIFEDLL